MPNGFDMPSRAEQKCAVLPLRNEVEATDRIDHSAKAPMGFAVTLVAGLHVLCCGLLLPLLFGLSVAAVFDSWPAIGAIVALLASAGLVWHVRKKAAPHARAS